jgi:hypothetical protein
MCKQFFYHSTLCAMCIKCMNVTRTKFMAYCNVKVFKKSNLWEFAAIDKTWPTFNRFYYFHFHKWTIDNLKAYIKFGTKLVHLTWKKRWNVR